MSERKTRVTVTIDPRLAAYAERLVEAGQADSVSAVVNSALSAQEAQDRDDLKHLREIAARADPAKVARMLAHVEAQRAELPPAYR
jgi:Arc/MetJ-type ribon-helix-helix transcriptional regulator